MNQKWDEIVIVVSRSHLFENERLSFNGTVTDQEVVKRIMTNAGNNFGVMRRGDKNDSTDMSNNAEINIKYKQLIPYVVIRKGNEVFTYKRLKGGGESRLHHKLSIGAGGHMNMVEGKETLSEIIFENMTRELEEELIIKSNKNKLITIGLINDDNFADKLHVGNVHLGLLVVMDIDDNGSVRVRETDQLEGFWSTLDQLKEQDVYEKLESWSQIAVEAMIKLK